MMFMMPTPEASNAIAPINNPPTVSVAVNESSVLRMESFVLTSKLLDSSGGTCRMARSCPIVSSIAAAIIASCGTRMLTIPMSRPDRP